MAEAPKKRGRPRLSDAEKKRREAEKAARPRKKPGPKKGSTRAKPSADPKPWEALGISKSRYYKKPQEKPAPAVIMANAEGIEGANVEGETGGEQKRGRGNPGKWKPEFVEVARALAVAGFTDEQMADHFEICTKTFYNWTAKHPEFLQAIKMAKDAPDDRTERSLYHRANGYEYTEEVPVKVKDIEYENGRKVKETERVELVKVKRFTPPDPTSGIFWLKNRRPDIWRDKKELDVNPHEDWLARLASVEGADA
jgi:hypothetical protein